jgi:hypothetical protein
MKKNEVQTGRLSQPATFADVARMIAPFNMPPWLPAHLEWWAQGIRYDRIVDQYRPTTSQTVERLSEVAEAARGLAPIRQSLKRNPALLATQNMDKLLGKLLPRKTGLWLLGVF